MALPAYVGYSNRSIPGIVFMVSIVGLTMANQSFYCLPSHIKQSFIYFKDKFLGQVGTLMTTAVKMITPERPDQENFITVQ